MKDETMRIILGRTDRLIDKKLKHSYEHDKYYSFGWNEADNALRNQGEEM